MIPPSWQKVALPGIIWHDEWSVWRERSSIYWRPAFYSQYLGERSPIFISFLSLWIVGRAERNGRFMLHAVRDLNNASIDQNQPGSLRRNWPSIALPHSQTHTQKLMANFSQGESATRRLRWSIFDLLYAPFLPTSSYFCIEMRDLRFLKQLLKIYVICHRFLKYILTIIA